MIVSKVFDQLIRNNSHLVDTTEIKGGVLIEFDHFDCHLQVMLRHHLVKITKIEVTIDVDNGFKHIIRHNTHTMPDDLFHITSRQLSQCKLILKGIE